VGVARKPRFAEPSILTL